MIGRDQMLDGNNLERQHGVPRKKVSASILKPGCSLHHLKDVNADLIGLADILGGKSLESSFRGF